MKKMTKSVKDFDTLHKIILADTMIRKHICDEGNKIMLDSLSQLENTKREANISYDIQSESISQSNEFIKIRDAARTAANLAVSNEELNEGGCSMCGAGTRMIEGALI